MDIHVGHQVLDDWHVAHRLDGDLLALGLYELDDLGLAGEARLMIDAHGAGAADGAATRAAERQAAIFVLTHLDEGVEHCGVVRHVDAVLLVWRGVRRGRVEAFDL